MINGKIDAQQSVDLRKQEFGWHTVISTAISTAIIPLIIPLIVLFLL